jgi:hypothetical protein
LFLPSSSFHSSRSPFLHFLLQHTRRWQWNRKLRR